MGDNNTSLHVKNLAQIREGAVQFGDMTLIIGPQASGKSIFLQLLKLAIDRPSIADTLKTYGYDWGKKPENFLELFYGESMSGIWKPNTEVKYGNKSVTRSTFLPKKGVPGKTSKEEKLFYIPAQRVVTMREGWPLNFLAFGTGDPYILKSFSETLRVLMEKEWSNGGLIFPKTGRLQESLRKPLEDSIFYGASVELDKSSLKKRFILKIEKSRLPYMTWSAGQKEFMPLLLSLYHLIPPSKISRKGTIEWVVIEEPEMGLHPRAIQSVLLLCLELMHRGYKVVISTHSPVLIELAWAVGYIQRLKGKANDLFNLFSLPKSNNLKQIFQTAIEQKTFKTYYFQRDDDGVRIKDISTLDAGNHDDATANWGGLSEFASRAAEVVAKLAANEEE